VHKAAAADGVAKVEYKRIASLEARLVALQAELEAARASVYPTDLGWQSLLNVNEASQATVKRRCKGFGADTAWRLVQVRARHGPFVSWGDLRQRVEGVGEALLKELQRRFELKPTRNLNTASSADLEDALTNARSGKRFEAMRKVARQIVEERTHGEFECWDDLLERVPFGSMGPGATKERVVEWLRQQCVRCESLAAEVAAAERAATLAAEGLPSLNLRRTRIPLSVSQLWAWRVDKELNPLAAMYAIPRHRTLPKAALVAAIMAEEYNRAFVADLVAQAVAAAAVRAERELAVATLVRDALQRVKTRGSRRAQQGAQTKAEGRGQSKMMCELHEERRIKRCAAELHVRDIGMRVAGDEGQLRGWRVKEELTPLAWQYGLEPTRPKAALVMQLLAYERKHLIPAGRALSGANDGAEGAGASAGAGGAVGAAAPEEPWAASRTLSIGSWNMLHLSEKTIGLGGEGACGAADGSAAPPQQAKHLDTVLSALASFDICAILELFDAVALPKLCAELARRTGEPWGWVQTPKLQSELVGFVWREAAATLTSSPSGAAGGVAGTLQQDGTFAYQFFHRPPAVVRFSPVCAWYGRPPTGTDATADPPEVLIVAAHVTFDGMSGCAERGAAARALELHNLAGALESLAAAEPAAMVVAVGDFNSNPGDAAWAACQAVGWQPQVRSVTMVESANCYDNVLLRRPRARGAGLGPGPGPGGEVELEWASGPREGSRDAEVIEEGVGGSTGNPGGEEESGAATRKANSSMGLAARARVAVVPLLKEMQAKFLGDLKSTLKAGGGLGAHAADKTAVNVQLEKVLWASFKGSVSDHLPVRLDILLPATDAETEGRAGTDDAPSTSIQGAPEPPRHRRVRGLNIILGGRHMTQPLRRYTTGVTTRAATTTRSGRASKLPVRYGEEAN
jgi:DNA uptake protein ComE-like DNA-binding protein